MEKRLACIQKDILQRGYFMKYFNTKTHNDVVEN
jgi:hypothetical protein